MFYHFASDMQKFIFLKYQSGLITDGFWKQCRHPNYFGELLIYLSFSISNLEDDFPIFLIEKSFIISF